MGRKKKTTEDQPQEGQQEEQGAVSKTDAVREAISQGIDSPEEGTAFVRDRFGLEVSNQYFSNIKSRMKGQQGRPKGKPGRKPGRKGPAGKHANARKEPQANGQADVLAALEAIKPLVASLGAERVKRLVDVLG